MVFGLWKRRKDMTPFAMYQSVMDQARQPVFYAEWGVPDTIEGRFDMLITHAVLALRRLKIVDPSRAEEAADRSQSLTDVLFKDLDRALRETGVGDVSVPKKMNKLASAFYGRGKSYGEALDARDEAALADALARNLATNITDEADGSTAANLVPAALANYLIACDEALARQADDDVLRGDFGWVSSSTTVQRQAGQLE
ncbi:MAG: ubiquinol-cytochrome C chaperone family protein [Pseudomonadota bacterium]